jgi:hypothetical protein
MARVGTGQVNVWGEGGTASCGGVDGISNTFASAQWNVDILFEFATRGVQLAIFSGTPQAIYAPLVVNAGKVEVRPSFYGMLLFNVILGGRNTKVYGPATSGSPLPLRIKAWAAVDQVTNTYTAVLLHKDPNTGDQQVSITAPIPNAYVQVVVMRAPAVDSPTGQTIAGHTIDGMTGQLAGTYTATYARADAGGMVTVTLPRAAALLVRFTAAEDKTPILTTTGLRDLQVSGILNNAGSNARTIPRSKAGAAEAVRGLSAIAAAFIVVVALLA